MAISLSWRGYLQFLGRISVIAIMSGGGGVGASNAGFKFVKFVWQAVSVCVYNIFWWGVCAICTVKGACLHNLTW